MEMRRFDGGGEKKGVKEVEVKDDRRKKRKRGSRMRQKERENG